MFGSGWSLVGLAALWAANCAFAAPAQAADAAASAPDEMIVTARRRDEALKDVPVAVSSLTERRLEQINAHDISALQQTTPNLTLQATRGTNSTLIAFIRGVGQWDPLWGFEPGVGIYVDDVYLARPQGALLDIFDVDHIEVLRGPQGTLYGRNTVGGAVKYVTRRLAPLPGITVKSQFGSYAQHDVVASASTPVGERLRIGGAIASYNRDGYGRNLTTGAAQYNQSVIAGRLSLEWTPTPDVLFRLAGDRTDDSSNPRHGHREAPFAGFGVLPNVYDTQAGLGDTNSVITEGASLFAQWSASPTLKLKSITAYRDGRGRTLIDIDNTPLPLFDVLADYDDRQFTQELQALYTGARVQGVAGVYFMNANSSGEFDSVAGNPALPTPPYPQTTATQGAVATKSYAVFADVSVDLTRRLAVSAGGRWTRDDKTGEVFRASYAGLRSPFHGAPNAVLTLLRTDYTRSKSFEEFTPRLSATFKASPDINVYASWSRGFKSGGIDTRGDAFLTPSTVNGYDPETVDTIEGGLKGSLLERRLNIRSAVFYSMYRGQQVTVQQLVGAIVATQVQNAGSSHIWGVELEGSAILTPSVTATFSLGYLDARFDKYLALNLATGQIQDVASQRVFQNTPKWSGYLGLTWSHDAPGGDVSLTFAGAYRGHMALFETPSVIDQNGYVLWNADITWNSLDGRYSVGVHGANLGDERYRIGGYPFSGSALGDSLNGFYGPPRTVSVALKVHI